SYYISHAGFDFTDPSYWDISEGNSITVGASAVEDEGIIATEYNLMQNYPNPFNPSTTITFSIPESGNVKLTVFNSLGEKVTTLVNEYISTGVKTVTFEAVNNFSGVYYYRLETSTFVDTKKMILLK
ncbi:MAG: T9SS type A sorting domain-containing protein, partial [Ignavibacteriaceae bacterium]